MSSTIAEDTLIFETHFGDWSKVEIRYYYSESVACFSYIYFDCLLKFHAGTIKTIATFTAEALTVFAEGLWNIYNLKGEQTHLASSDNEVEIECRRNKLGHLRWRIKLHIGKEVKINTILDNDLTYLPPTLALLDEFLTDYAVEKRQEEILSPIEFGMQGS